MVAPDPVLATALDAVLTQFGMPATLRLAGEPPAAVTAVYYAAHELVSADGLSVSAVVPTLLVRLADLPRTPQRGDAADVGTLTFRVEDVQIDAIGASALLILERT